MNLWDKIVAWVEKAVVTVEHEVTADEKALLALVKPLFGTAEATLVAEIKAFIEGAVSTGPKGRTLVDWETAIMNGLQLLEHDALATAEALGSNVLQAIIGLVLARLQQAAAPK